MTIINQLQNKGYDYRRRSSDVYGLINEAVATITVVTAFFYYNNYFFYWER